jgi:hypothetical protein
MPRTSPDSSARVVALSDVGAVIDMTVLEFCVGMALARRGSLTAREIAGEVSIWLDKPVRCRVLNGQLRAIAARGWASLEAGTYTLSEAGIEALRGFYSALVRMLDGGRRLLDIAVFMSLIKEFERSGS